MSLVLPRWAVVGSLAMRLALGPVCLPAPRRIPSLTEGGVGRRECRSERTGPPARPGAASLTQSDEATACHKNELCMTCPGVCPHVLSRRLFCPRTGFPAFLCARFSSGDSAQLFGACLSLFRDSWGSFRPRFCFRDFAWFFNACGFFC